MTQIYISNSVDSPSSKNIGLGYRGGQPDATISPKISIIYSYRRKFVDRFPSTLPLSINLKLRNQQIGGRELSHKNVNQFQKCAGKLIIAYHVIARFYESDSCDNARCDLDKIVCYNSI